MLAAASEQVLLLLSQRQSDGLYFKHSFFFVKLGHAMVGAGDVVGEIVGLSVGGAGEIVGRDVGLSVGTTGMGTPES